MLLVGKKKKIMQIFKCNVAIDKNQNIVIQIEPVRIVVSIIAGLPIINWCNQHCIHQTDLVTNTHMDPMLLIVYVEEYFRAYTTISSHTKVTCKHFNLNHAHELETKTLGMQK